MSANTMKFIAGLVGLGVWTAFAVLKMTPVDPLIDLLKMGLGGLIVLLLKDASQGSSTPPAPTPGASP